MSFKKNKYQVIRGAISKELADVAYRYLQISAEADNWMINNYTTHKGNPLVGNFHDKQVPGSYAKYSDRLMEVLLVKTIDTMQKKTGLKLVPTYSYNKTHTHPNSLWSGVYYIKVPKNSGKLFLEDPRPGPNTHMPRRVEGVPEALWRVCAYEPAEGRMIFFPSWLPHGVDINLNTDKGEKNWRISVSFNFIQI